MQPTDKPSFLRVNARGLIVVAVLVTLLIVVLAVQFSGGAATVSCRDGEPEVKSQDSPTAERPVRPTPESRKPIRSQDAPTPWLPMALEQVIGYDPFRTPEPPADEAPEEPVTDDSSEDDEEEDTEEDTAELRRQIEAARQTALAALREQGVGAFLAGGSSGNVAVIGDRTVRPGDVIDGFRVVSVGPDGMIVEPVALP